MFDKVVRICYGTGSLFRKKRNLLKLAQRKFELFGKFPVKSQKNSRNKQTLDLKIAGPRAVVVATENSSRASTSPWNCLPCWSCGMMSVQVTFVIRDLCPSLKRRTGSLDPTLKNLNEDAGETMPISSRIVTSDTESLLKTTNITIG